MMWFYSVGRVRFLQLGVVRLWRIIVRFDRQEPVECGHKVGRAFGAKRAEQLGEKLQNA